jgi:uncharacterized protein
MHSIAAQFAKRKNQTSTTLNLECIMKYSITKLAAVMTLSFGTSAMAADFEKQSVSFKVDGQTVRGDLYLPKGITAATKLPAVIVGGSLTSVKEQMSAAYAKELAGQGFAALAFDYRHYGQSEGMPRQLESVEAKKADLKGAVSFLQTHARIDPQGIALLGVCTSGGNVIQAAAEDTRIKAVATVAGWFAEPALTPALYGGDAAVANLKAQSQKALAKYRSTGQSDTVQTYGMAGSGAAHAGDHMDYYVNPQRGNIAQWTNAMAVQSWQSWLSFDPVSTASKVTVPTMIIHSDDSALPDQAKKVFGLLAGKKELNWMTGGHFEFYDSPAKVKAAAGEVARFVRAQVAQPAHIAAAN